MKIIRAVIREERVPYVQKALLAIQIPGMTCSPVRGRGSQRGIHLQFRGGVLNIDLIPKVLVEIVIRDDQETVVIEQIITAARTGREGDGRIFVLPVTEAHRVRTTEVEV